MKLLDPEDATGTDKPPCGNIYGTFTNGVLDGGSRREQLIEVLAHQDEKLTVAFTGTTDDPTAVLIYRHDKQFSPTVHISSAVDEDGAVITGEDWRKIILAPYPGANTRVDELVFICKKASDTTKGLAQKLLQSYVENEILLEGGLPFVLFASQADVRDANGDMHSIVATNLTAAVKRSFYAPLWQRVVVPAAMRENTPVRGEIDIKTSSETQDADDSVFEACWTRRFPAKAGNEEGSIQPPQPPQPPPGTGTVSRRVLHPFSGYPSNLLVLLIPFEDFTGALQGGAQDEQIKNVFGFQKDSAQYNFLVKTDPSASSASSSRRSSSRYMVLLQIPSNKTGKYKTSDVIFSEDNVAWVFGTRGAALFEVCHIGVNKGHHLIAANRAEPTWGWCGLVSRASKASSGKIRWFTDDDDTRLTPTNFAKHIHGRANPYAVRALYAFCTLDVQNTPRRGVQQANMPCAQLFHENYDHATHPGIALIYSSLHFKYVDGKYQWHPGSNSSLENSFKEYTDTWASDLCVLAEGE